MDEVIKIENKMNFYFENTEKDNIMTEEIEEDFKNNNIFRFDFVRKILNLIKLEIFVIQLVNTEVQLIVTVILILHRKKVILFHFYFTILVTMIVICSSGNWLK